MTDEFSRALRTVKWEYPLYVTPWLLISLAKAGIEIISFNADYTLNWRSLLPHTAHHIVQYRSFYAIFRLSFSCAQWRSDHCVIWEGSYNSKEGVIDRQWNLICTIFESSTTINHISLCLLSLTCFNGKILVCIPSW